MMALNQFTKGLNDRQKEAVEHTEGPLLIMAGAGSGKTRVLTHRMAYILSEKDVNPWNILAITFTNKAAKEMKERVSALVGPDANDMWVSTFHSMCVKILRKHISSLKSTKNINSTINFDSNFSIYTDTEKDKAIKTVIQNLKIEKDGFEKKVEYHISNAKNRNLSPWDYQKLNQDVPDIEDITKAYSAYQSFLASNNALDFDDLLTKTYELFIEFPDILRRYQNKFEYIHIDEFQDTNYIQYQIAHLLALGHGNIFVVGDEDQCIYSWRGANIENIRSFQQDFPDYKMFKLEQNYRSTKEILTIANKLIKNNQIRNDKVLWTENKVGNKIDCYKATDEFDEAEHIALTIKTMVANMGYKYSDFAVLTRLNAMSAPFEEKFLNYNIPYKIFGGNKFFERLEIKNLVSYLKMLANPYDSTSFARIINYPKRGIGEATIANILQLAEFHNTTPYNLILSSDEYMLDASLERKIKPFKDIVQKLNDKYETLPGYEFIEFLVKTIDFKSVYNTSSEEDLSRLLNVDNFLVMAQEYFKNNPKSTVSEFLQSITLVTDMDEYDDKANTVTIATVHAVKGLEFRVVFVAGLEERMFPIVRTYSTQNDMEEERRLMFVAITRAEERLFLSYAKSRFVFGRRDYSLPSRFLKECEMLEIQPSFSKPQTSPISNSFPTFAKKSFSLNKFETSTEKQKSDSLATKYFVGARVSHPKFGKGTITSNQGIAITKCVSINFDGIGVKTLSVEYAPITIVN